MIGKKCDYCKTAGAAVYCRADTAFLCVNCDSKIHDQQQTLVVARHERVWVCDVCEQAPAAFTCKADSASLCVSCDSDIHSANHLASRHVRLPVQSFFDSADSLLLSKSSELLLQLDEAVMLTMQPSDEYVQGHTHLRNMEMKEFKEDIKNEPFFPNSNSNFLDSEYPDSIDCGFHNFDGVVPVHNLLSTLPPPAQLITNNNCKNKIGFDHSSTKLMPSSFNYSVPTHSSLNGQTISTSSSSLEIGVVPDGNPLPEVSFSFFRNNTMDPKMQTSFITSTTTTTTTTTNTCTSTNTTIQSESVPRGGGGNMDREARVLRYRERRKNRKFHKTIRYASRKAYAETRPRIKGRFAKRTNDQTDLNVHSSDDVGSLYNYIINNSTFNLPDDEIQYGVVPGF